MKNLIKNFLPSRKGLEYLLMKYPTLSVEEAIVEFRASVLKASLVKTSVAV